MAQSGATTRELMQRMGHSTMRAALTYQHATEARARELVDRLDALVLAQRQHDREELRDDDASARSMHEPPE